MASKSVSKKEKHGWNTRNGSQKCLLKRKTWLEKINMAQIMREKHVSYIRDRRVRPKMTIFGPPHNPILAKFIRSKMRT